ncbi:hypothetical protein Bca4012_033958 [Brassica carinata]|uniref:Serpin domain-containing protein n=1 Tax=Brassica oleracea var. oleracea TaxID=109376 RepID=A0A0D3C4B6_BRAOL|nr:PREDICTED: serpin-ZX-like [Brassica oleracea var. oleracea]XP_013744666.1 serpin-ZX-like [Brassica napus]
MDLQTSVGKQNEIVLNFAKHVIATTDAKTSNLVFSPASINVILSFLAVKSGGSTANHILSLLQASSITELNAVSSKVITDVLADSTATGGPTISVANGVWMDKSLPVEPCFTSLVENTYKANFNQVDFGTKADEVVEEVNAWVENQTRGLITDLLSFASPETDLIFANALFFHGRWDEEFNPSLTKDSDFHRLDGTKLRVPFMSAYASYKHRLEVYQGFKVLHLPYRGGSNYLEDNRFSMQICLPDDKDGLHAMLESLSSCRGFLNGYIPGQCVSIGEVKIPTFKFGFDFDVSKALKGLGLETPLEKIVHKACIEVDEVGTKAAAATAVSFCGGILRPQKKYDFVADHPFLFLVKEYRSGLVLFLGQVLDPSMH